jgi:hypothetical protein
MAAGAWTFTNASRGYITDGTIATGDTFKMALVTSSSNIGASTTTFAGVTNEVSETNTGYTAGGESIALTQSGTTTVTVVMTTAPVWTAGTANLTARWAIIYEVGGNVLFYALLDDSPADVTATDGNTLTVGSDGGTVYTAS